MFFSWETSVDTTRLESSSKLLSALVETHVMPAGESELVAPHASLYFGCREAPVLYRVEDGCVRVMCARGPMMVIEEGELVFPMPVCGTRVWVETPDFAVVLRPYAEQELLACISRSLEFSKGWYEWHTAQRELLCEVIAGVMQVPDEPMPQLRRFAPGEAIIVEGAEDDVVYTLVEGAADVWSHGVVVGEVQKDEIFGAIAAMTGCPRTATVVARQECLVLELDSGSFQDLVRARPGVVSKLIRDMARSIMSLNKGRIEERRAALSEDSESR
jgi:CRP/FNR family cyclic AMP-dependent transcriptional regulator